MKNDSENRQAAGGARPQVVSKSQWREMLLRKGPLAIFGSALPGGANYFVILFLTFLSSDESIGVFRIIISMFALANLYAVSETSKVYIRCVAQRDKKSATSLLVNQALFSVSIFILCLTAVLVDRFLFGGAALPDELLAVSAISALYMPTQCYMAYLQAERRFAALAATEFTKYGSSLVSFLIAYASTGETVTAVYSQLGTMCFWNVVLFLRFSVRFIDFSEVFRGIRRHVLKTPAAEARVLSLSALLPGTLEHLDKFLLGYSQGLAVLGIYTLAFTTGRFFYNIIKPATYVFWRGYVDRMPTTRVLGLIWVSFTAFGAVVSGLYYLMTEYVPAMAPFREGRTVATIIFLSWGMALVNTIYTQSYAINKDRKSTDVLVANTIGTLCAAPVIIAASFIPDAGWAMIVFASFYPISHLTISTVLWRLDKNHRQTA